MESTPSRESVLRSRRLRVVVAGALILGVADEPLSPGNPVFSIHQTDIIWYGFDLQDYLRREFEMPRREPWPDEVRTIRFWDIDRFQGVRWADGSAVTDPRTLPAGGSSGNEVGANCLCGFFDRARSRPASVSSGGVSISSARGKVAPSSARPTPARARQRPRRDLSLGQSAPRVPSRRTRCTSPHRSEGLHRP